MEIKVCSKRDESRIPGIMKENYPISNLILPSMSNRWTASQRLVSSVSHTLQELAKVRTGNEVFVLRYGMEEMEQTKKMHPEQKNTPIECNIWKIHVLLLPWALKIYFYHKIDVYALKAK